MIKFNNVSKSYGNLDVIKDINLEIKRGSIHGFIGISGAGKSTLLRLINNLEDVSSGEIIYSDKIKFGFVFQNFNLVNSLSVYDNIALGLIDLDNIDIDLKIHEVLKLVNLEDKINYYPNQLSGGQKQRVGIARALAMDVDVLLCDEATSALDPFTASEIIALLTKLNQQLNLTIVFVSHQLEIIKDFCDYISIIHDGINCESDSVINVFSKPKDDITKLLLQNALDIDYKDNAHVIYGSDNTNKFIKENDNFVYIKQITTKQGSFSFIKLKEMDV